RGSGCRPRLRFGALDADGRGNSAGADGADGLEEIASIWLFAHNALRPRMSSGLRGDRRDDVTRRDAIVIDQLFGRAAARNLADAQAFDGKTTLGHRGSNRVSDATSRIVILDGNEALRFSCAPQQRT